MSGKLNSKEHSSDEEDVYENALSVSPPKDNNNKDTNEQIINNLIKEGTGLSLDDNAEQDDTNNLEDDSIQPDLTTSDESSRRDYEQTLTKEELLANKEEAIRLKTIGNEQFKNEENAECVDTYTRALEICPMDCVDDRSVLFGNRAAGHIKLNNKLAAIDDCTKSLELNPKYMRALIR